MQPKVPSVAQPSESSRAHLLIQDEDDSPQRYPLARLLVAVQQSIGSEIEVWRVCRVWGQGRATAQLENALEEIDAAEDMAITTKALLDLDNDPNEWFFDVIIRSEDGSVSFGIFDSSFMFVDGPWELVRAVGSRFVDTTEVDWAIDR